MVGYAGLIGESSAWQHQRDIALMHATEEDLLELEALEPVHGGKSNPRTIGCCFALDPLARDARLVENFGVAIDQVIRPNTDADVLRLG